MIPAAARPRIGAPNHMQEISDRAWRARQGSASGRRGRLRTALALALPAALASANAPPATLVLQTDFGLRDHAVAAMRGVARLVSPQLIIDDLTHEVPAFDIWQAAYRLQAVVEYWPANTVFVSVVDPGVGSARESVVARLVGGPLVVTPNNGTLTLLHDHAGIAAVRRIDEAEHRLPGSADSHTFHGRDLYVHVGALLASGALAFDDLGAPTEAKLLRYEEPRLEDGAAHGGVPVLDPQFGNVWTNIPAALGGFEVDRSYEVRVAAPDGAVRFAATVPLVRTFSEVPLGEPLLYVNSIGNLALALNQADFAARFAIASGPGWQATIRNSRP